MIYIDTREPNEISSYFAAHNILFFREKMIIGDFAVHGILIERKTWTDFFMSYSSGRLYKQMLQLHQHFGSILILEGFHLDAIAKKETFYTILIKILVQYNVRIMFTLDTEHTAAFLIALERITQKEKKFCTPPKILPMSASLSNTKKRILCCFPFIGDIKAKRILEQCPTLRKLFTTPPKELKLYGIGKIGQKAFEEILD